MNILIPDSWLREFIDTPATPSQIKEYVSLCGPSIERIYKEGREFIYDVEITSNRPDSMSVFGVAREIAAILPQFGIKTRLADDPYTVENGSILNWVDPSRGQKLRVIIETNPTLNLRWSSIILENVQVKPSPSWLKKRLELSGLRSLNNVVDITNYIMRMYGQPVHAFDFDEIKPNDLGVPYMKLRLSKNDEIITTLDGKTYTLTGEEIIIEDGEGRIIDLCGIMGAQNSSVNATTTRVLLFMQVYNPVQIRKAAMGLGIRTEAASLFEKGLDTELVLSALLKGIQLMQQITQCNVASKIYDFYPDPYKSKQVWVTRAKIDAYVGTKLTPKQIRNTLESLGFRIKIDSDMVSVHVPSFRRDIAIDVDIIEEIARMYGYHKISTRLPDSEPPVVILDPILNAEEEVKVRLRDWGYTETYNYSMISEEFMDIFNLNKNHAYKISNPLSSDWLYMRPSLLPNLLQKVQENLHHRSEFKLFELSMIYAYRENDLPYELPTLGVIWTGERFFEAKGLATALFKFFGISYGILESIQGEESNWYSNRNIRFGDYGQIGELNQTVLSKLKINCSITALSLNFEKIVNDSRPAQKYIPIPKYPPVIEDLNFIFSRDTAIGQVMTEIKLISSLIYSVSVLNRYENSIAFRINYLNPEKPLTETEVISIREKIIATVKRKFSADLKK